MKTWAIFGSIENLEDNKGLRVTHVNISKSQESMYFTYESAYIFLSKFSFLACSKLVCVCVLGGS